MFTLSIRRGAVGERLHNYPVCCLPIWEVRLTPLSEGLSTPQVLHESFGTFQPNLKYILCCILLFRQLWHDNPYCLSLFCKWAKNLSFHPNTNQDTEIYMGLLPMLGLLVFKLMSHTGSSSTFPHRPDLVFASPDLIMSQYINQVVSNFAFIKCHFRLRFVRRICNLFLLLGTSSIVQLSFQLNASCKGRQCQELGSVFITSKRVGYFVQWTCLGT